VYGGKIIDIFILVLFHASHALKKLLQKTDHEIAGGFRRRVMR
jgi:hypothetical protein